MDLSTVSTTPATDRPGMTVDRAAALIDACTVDLRNDGAAQPAGISAPISADLSRVRALIKQQQASRRLNVAEASELGRVIRDGIELLQTNHKRALFDVLDLIGTLGAAGFDPDRYHGNPAVFLEDAEQVMRFGAQIVQHAPQLADAIIGSAHWDQKDAVLWWDARRLTAEAA